MKIFFIIIEIFFSLGKNIESLCCDNLRGYKFFVEVFFFIINIIDQISVYCVFSIVLYVYMFYMNCFYLIL